MNVAELRFSVLAKQCLVPRLGDVDTPDAKIAFSRATEHDMALHRRAGSPQCQARLPTTGHADVARSRSITRPSTWGTQSVERTELGAIVVDETQIMTQTKLIGQE